MTRCSVHGCKSGSFSNNLSNIQNNIRPPTLFMVPKSPTAIAKWKAALNQDLPPKSRVCELHFADADVKRSDDTLMPDGSIFRLPRQKFSLCKNAVPKDLVNQENKAPENKKIDPSSSNKLHLEPTVLETDEMITAHGISKADTFLSDHQYYIHTNKPGQYCYYNKKVAACFTIPSLGDDFQEISEEKQAYSNKKLAIDSNTENNVQKNLENQVKKLEDTCSVSLESEQNSLTVEGIIDYLLKSPIRRSWSWMKFTKKDMGITFTQIHFRTRKVRCYIELYEDLSAMIQTGDEQISLEIEFEITSIEHVLDLLATVEKMKICTGTGYEHESRDKNCNGIIPDDEEYKTRVLCDRCVACRSLRKQLRVRQKYSRIDIKTRYEKVKKERDLLRRKCKYYENRLNLKNKRLKIIKEMIKSYNKNHKNTL